MGAWGAGIFENDEALDWVFELEQAEDISFLEENLKIVTERGDEYLDASEASVALAAAEVVAALMKAALPDLPDEVKKWVGEHTAENSNLAQLALKATQRIRANSELKELWDESNNAADWYAVMDNLEERLKL